MDRFYKIGFMVEQTLGHITHGRNLQENVRRDASIDACWGWPSWESRGVESKLPLVRSNWTLRAGLQTRQILSGIQSQTKLDALFFHTQVTAILCSDWLRRIPSVISLDATPIQYDTLGEFYNHRSGSRWLERQKLRMNRDCFRSAQHLVTWSDWAKDSLVNDYGIPEMKITVIPPGTDIQAWTSPEAERRQTGPVKILFVGADFRRKGGLVLLQAFRDLRQQICSRNPVELHLVTREKMPPEPDVFVYNDMQPNSAALKQLYFNSHIFCLPTYGDCLPMALSEAGAASLPLVSTRLAAIPEIVRDGETGFLVTQGEAGVLASVLQRLVEDAELRSCLGRAAFRWTSQHYDSRQNTGQLLEILKQLADKGWVEPGAG